MTSLLRRFASAELIPGTPGLGLTVVIVDTIAIVALTGRRDGGSGRR
ncbi:MAG TPA: hypothetical protein VJ506_01060 [Candidatus Limnocylindrales bacterium]|nr:hypothetical protein [Candidatus Limnocylindrales bacterium]